MTFVGAALFAAASGVVGSAHAKVECTTSSAPEVVDDCHVLYVLTDEQRAELAKKPHRTLRVWMSAPATKEGLADLVKATWLEQLELDAMDELGLQKSPLDDLSPLAALTHMRRLGLSQDRLKDVAFLETMKELEYLDLSLSKVGDLSGLAKAVSLRELHVSVHGKQADLLTGLVRLERLDVGGLSSLAPLAKLTKLKDLHVTFDGGSGPVSTAPLLAMTAMTALRIDTHAVLDLGGLQNMSALDTLEVSGSQVSDLTPLAGCAKLRVLWVGSTKVTSLAPLAKIATLEHVDVGETAVTDLSPLLASAKTLRSLRVPSSMPKQAWAALVAANPKLVVTSS